MVALNFQPWKAPMVESGTCRQTIRSDTRARVGCSLQLYTGQRTKACRKLRPDETCTGISRVTLMERVVVQTAGLPVLTGLECDEFAKADGFVSYSDMWAFFKHKANEHGEVIGFRIRW